MYMNTHTEHTLFFLFYIFEFLKYPMHCNGIYNGAIPSFK